MSSSVVSPCPGLVPNSLDGANRLYDVLWPAGLWEYLPPNQECQAPAPLSRGKPTHLGQRVNKAENVGGHGKVRPAGL